MKRSYYIFPLSFLVVISFVSKSISADYTVVQLTNNYSSNLAPQINDSGYVVWHESDGSDTEIFLYDRTVVTQLTDNSIYDYAPQINDSGYVVWCGQVDWETRNSEIFLYDGSTVIQLTNSYNVKQLPRINNNNMIVWVESGQNIFMHFLWTLILTTILTMTLPTVGVEVVLLAICSNEMLPTPN